MNLAMAQAVPAFVGETDIVHMAILVMGPHAIDGEIEGSKDALETALMNIVVGDLDDLGVEPKLDAIRMKITQQHTSPLDQCLAEMLTGMTVSHPEIEVVDLQPSS